MREQDMRLRIERFMKARLRNMLMPATLGLGLAVGGCNGDALSTDDGGDPLVKQDAAAQTDTGGPSVTQMPDAGPELPIAMPDYMAQMPDAGPEVPVAMPEYMAPITKEDAGIAVRYMAQMPDADRAIPVYLAQIPE
jgi:hypothetical protein